MCTGLELLTAFSGLVGTVGAVAGAKAPKVPETPAIAPPTDRAPGATVRIGSGQDTETNTDSTAPTTLPTYTQRSEGKSLTGLGRSGLAI